MHLPCFLPNWILSLHAGDRHFCSYPEFLQQIEDRLEPPNTLLLTLSWTAAFTCVCAVLALVWLRREGIYHENLTWLGPLGLLGLALVFRLLA